MKVAIRKFRESDAAEFQEAVLSSVEHIGEWLSWCTPNYSIKDATEWARSAAQMWEEGTDYRFIIENSETGEILGTVGIHDVVAQNRIGSLGYWVRKSAINQGVCSNAARQAVRVAFDELGFRRIEIHVQLDNHASNAVAARIGGVYEGTARNKIMFKGNSVAAKCYSIIPSDYAG